MSLEFDIPDYCLTEFYSALFTFLQVVNNSLTPTVATIGPVVFENVFFIAGING